MMRKNGTVKQMRIKVFLLFFVIPLIVKSQKNISQPDTIYPCAGKFATSISAGFFFYTLPALIPQIGYKWRKHSLFTGLVIFAYSFYPEAYFDVKYSYSFFSKNKSSFVFSSMFLYALRGKNFGLGLTPVAIEYQRKLSERLSIGGSLGLNFLADQYAFIKSPVAIIDFAYTFNRKNKIIRKTIY